MSRNKVSSTARIQPAECAVQRLNKYGWYLATGEEGCYLQDYEGTDARTNGAMCTEFQGKELILCCLAIRLDHTVPPKRLLLVRYAPVTRLLLVTGYMTLDRRQIYCGRKNCRKIVNGEIHSAILLLWDTIGLLAFPGPNTRFSLSSLLLWHYWIPCLFRAEYTILTVPFSWMDMFLFLLCLPGLYVHFFVATFLWLPPMILLQLRQLAEMGTEAPQHSLTSCCKYSNITPLPSSRAPPSMS
jgi:hypothetical protein